MAYALRAALPYLTTASFAGQAGLGGQLGSLGQRCRDLGRRVESAESGAQGCGWDGDYGAAQDRAGGKPLDTVGDQVGDGKQAAELERCHQVAGDALMRGGGPGAVQPWGARALQRIGFGKPS